MFRQTPLGGVQRRQTGAKNRIVVNNSETTGLYGPASRPQNRGFRLYRGARLRRVRSFVMMRFGKVRTSLSPMRPLGRRDIFCSLGQVVRTLLLFGLFCTGMLIAAHANARAETISVSDAQFRTFVTGLWPDARKAGVSRTTFDTAFKSLTPDPSVLKIIGRQAEFVKPIWHYIDSAVSPTRIERGNARANELQPLLARIEAKYGVDRYIVLAVWGMETNYGGFSGKMNVIRSLATLGAAGHRGGFFREQLIVALQILEQRHIEPQNMLGSWAGAMGQTQFMPTSFMQHAIDFDGDGHKNIWTNIPDALASTANYLAANGWIRDWTWGYEVRLPRGFSLRNVELSEYRGFEQWSKAGIARADGQTMPRTGEAALVLPAGRNGPAFLVTRNFQVIKSYNTSSAYAFGVALLSDRLAGSSGLQAKWPVDAPVLDPKQSLEMQKHLVRLGFPVGELDGKIGEKAQSAIRQFQRRAGLEPDGFASVPLLEKMRMHP